MKCEGLSCGDRLSRSALEDLRRRAVLDCFKWNLDDAGETRLASFPFVLSRAVLEQLSRWAVSLDAEARAAEEEISRRPELHASLGLPWPLRLALRRAIHQKSVRFARFDFHPTEDGGFAITEGNTDVAGGFNESSGVTKLFAAHVDSAEPAGDPSACLAAALRATLKKDAAIGLLHMTNFVDDHQVVRFLASHMELAGLVPIFFGPSQLRWHGATACARVGSRTIELDAVFRFFPADWLPRLDITSRWWRVFESGATRWVNPATSILTQSKRFPLVWSRLSTPLTTWRALLPETRDPRDASGDDWVLKPALAHEGYRVGMTGVSERESLARIVHDSKRSPRRWVAQHRFAAATLETPDGPVFPSIGVYVIDGRPAGLYGRMAKRPLIDDGACDVVVLVDEE